MLITDIVMPEMDGSELVGKLLAFKSDVKIITTSGYDKKVEYGGWTAAHLEKPIEKKELLTCVEKCRQFQLFCVNKFAR